MHENQATETAYPARPLNVNQAGVQNHFREFAFLNLHFFLKKLYLFCIAFLHHLHFLSIYDFLFFAFSFCSYFLFAFLGSIFDIFCIACCIFSRFKISRIGPQGADTTNRIFRFDSVILDPVSISPGAELKALGFQVGVIKLLDFRP